MNKKVLLIIMDGWGEGDGSKADIISSVSTPFIDSLKSKAAYSRLKCSGLDVGLPEGQMGNSEVGHLNIGAGRVVFQDFVRINNAVADNSIAQVDELKKAYEYALAQNKNVHFLGLVSEGGVHSSTKHLMKLCDVAHSYGLENVFIHAFTDGRDTDPRSGLHFVEDLETHLIKSTGKIASVCGRYYAMDRDKRWERVKVAYDMLRNAKGTRAFSATQAISKSYDQGVTDEFIEPIIITDSNNKPLATLKEGDVVICFNFRTDRLRELTTVLTQKSMPEFDMQPITLKYVTLTKYDETFKNISVLFDKDDLPMTLGEVLSLNNCKQLRIAETEKYPHVTFFFSGGREKPFEQENRIMVSSPKVPTYDLKPSMSAFELRDKLIADIDINDYAFICLNFANADMVGHTGIYNAICEAVTTVDKCVGDVSRYARKLGYTVLITADHGNADFAINSDGTPNTAHSTNPVPFYLWDDDYAVVADGILADIAPTVLKLLGLNMPVEMTGTPLI